MAQTTKQPKQATIQATILVVDDEEVNCRLLEALLAAKGHTVRAAASGEEALQAAAAQPPDLILLDIMMPGIDGFEVTRRLKADSSSRHIPIILVTSLTDRESRLKGLEAGANEFISKPVDRAELLTRVTNLLKVKEFNDFIVNHNRILEEQVAKRTAALQESEERYRKIIQNSMDGFWVADTGGRILEVNDAYCKMIHYAREELLNMRISDVEAQETPEATAQHMQEIRAQGRVRFETRHRRKDGQLLDLEISVDYYPDKESGRFSVFLRDITERKLMELELRESEARYRRITEGLTDYLYTVRVENGRAVETTHSPACVTVTGYTVEEFAANPHLWIQMVAPEDRERVTKHVRQILAGDNVQPIEHRITRKNGEIRWVSDTAILSRDAAGKLLSYDGVIKDINERKQAKEKLRESRESLNRLLNSIVEGAYGVDTNGNCTFVNPSCLRMLGYQSSDELLGKHMHTLIHHSHADGSPCPVSECSIYRAYQSLEIIHVSDEVFWRKDGNPFPVEYWSSPILAGGVATGSIITFVDITERKQAEEEIRQLNTGLEQRVAERTTELELALSTMLQARNDSS